MKADNFLRDTKVMFFATIVSSVCALLYQLFMVRTLSPTDFGILNSLLSITIIVSMPAGPLQAVVTKFISTFKAKNNFGKINRFLLLFFKRVFVFGLVFFMVFLLFKDRIASFLKIEDKLLIIMIGIIMMFSVVLPFNLGGLQGLQKFKSLGAASIINALLRLLLGIMLVQFGFKVYGALGAIILASLLALIYTFIPLKKYFLKYKMSENDKLDNVVDMHAVYKYFLPTFIALSSFGLLTNTDIVLVKHFFSPVDAGNYSIAQMFGKIILFLPGAITMVMFPKLNETYARNGNTMKMLKKCLFLTGLICFSASAFCIAFSQFCLKLLAGKVHLECIPLIAPFVISMSFFALNNVFLYYHLSTHNMRAIYMFLCCVVLQVSGILLYHNSLVQVLYVLTGSAVVLFFVNGFYAKRLVEG